MSNIHLVQLSNYVQPDIKEEYGKDWVTYGKKNEYFQYLIDRSYGSGTNGAVVQSIIDLIYGEGLTATDATRKPDEYAQMKSIFGDEDVFKLINDLKRMGQCAIQVTYKGGHKKIDKAKHIPVECLAAEKVGENREIEAYYYAPEWSKVKSRNDLTRIPAFGTSKEGVEILYVKPYKSGMFYYSIPDNHGGLQYAELEEEIGNYHVNNVQNAFAPSMLINYNNGVPDEEQQAEIVKKTQAKFQGSSNAGRVIIAFNDNAENAATIEAVQLSDASDQYQFLSDECMRKILVSHRVTSPLLLGISTNTGFGSNADELKTASMLFEHQVIAPFRQLMIRAFNKILAFNDISLKLEFTSINPFEVGAEEAVEELKLSHKGCTHLYTGMEFDDKDMFDALAEFGEDEDLDNWECIHEMDVDYDMDDELNAMLNLANTGTARPNAKSDQDGEGAYGEKYKVRYQYAPLKTSENSRTFCKMMVNANKVYRKEDIIQMEKRSVNPGWGPGGADTYSVWKYKGGGGCHHKWLRKVYKQREGAKSVDVRNPNAQTVSVEEAKRNGFRPETNESEVSIAPKNMPGRGFLDGRK
jgi:hypothetical protein